MFAKLASEDAVPLEDCVLTLNIQLYPIRSVRRDGLAAKERLKSRILRLLKEDEEFRYAVAGLIGMEEILKRLDRNEQEVRRIWQEIEKLREDMMRGFERHDREIERLREDMNKLREDMLRMFERHEERFARIEQELAKLREDMMRGFDLVNSHISALGARWGMMAEDAFREGLRGILEKELGLKVERWTARDDEGIVYGYASVIEVDVAVKDGKILLIEVSSRISPSDVAAFVRKAELYEKETGTRPDRLIMVTPYAEEKAVEAALKLGVEIYTRV